MKTILITGITGQDGLFLTKKYLEEFPEIKIIGVTRKTKNELFFNRLKKLNIKNYDNISLLNVDLTNKNSTKNFLEEIKPTYVVNLSGPSSVYESLLYPKKTIHQITMIFENLTTSLIELNNLCNFFQSSSSEMYDSKLTGKLDEQSKMIPNSPYAEGKLYNHNKVITLSDKYNWNIVSGIMFNHESEFRDDSYLTSKIINKAYKISKNQESTLTIGSLDYLRDWSFAGDIAEAIFKLISTDAKKDFVIGSGKSWYIRDLLEIIFSYFNLNYQNHTVVDRSLLRDGDPIQKLSNPEKIFNTCGWCYTMEFEDLIKRCIENKTLI